MNRQIIIAQWLGLAVLAATITSCNKDRIPMEQPVGRTITVENVLDSRRLVESGTFQGTGTPPVILPGASVSFHFSASPGQAVTFATMYGWSNDLFFAPANPGITLYDTDKKPIEGDVSGEVKLWDNGTRINQVPGASVVHPGVADSSKIKEVAATDAQGNSYVTASKLLKATLKYDGDAYFTLTLENISGGTANETPFSPGVWAVSYIVGGNLLNATPLYAEGQPTANGLTSIAEAGDNVPLDNYVQANTGIFTPLSPILVVVYSGIDNPIYKLGENDRGQGLKDLAQHGDASVLAAFLEGKKGIKKVYVLPVPETKVLLPMIDGQPGGMVSQDITVEKGDRLAVTTMYGFSNDWFFSTKENGVDPTQPGDISTALQLYNDGTAIDQFPGAGNSQFNLGNATAAENKVISEVPNPNPYTTLPTIDHFIKVIIK